MGVGLFSGAGNVLRCHGLLKLGILNPFLHLLCQNTYVRQRTWWSYADPDTMSHQAHLEQKQEYQVLLPSRFSSRARPTHIRNFWIARAASTHPDTVSIPSMIAETSWEWLQSSPGYHNNHKDRAALVLLSGWVKSWTPVSLKEVQSPFLGNFEGRSYTEVFELVLKLWISNQQYQHPQGLVGLGVHSFEPFSNFLNQKTAFCQAFQVILMHTRVWVPLA